MVLKIDGKDIVTSIDLSSRVGVMKPGSTANLEVWRNGKPLKSADELKSAVKGARIVALLVKRDDASIYVPVELG